MTRRERPGCDVPAVPHGLRRPRFYPCGWRCTRHTPAAMAGKPEPGTTTRKAAT